MSKFKTWEELKKELNITPEQQAEIDLEVEILKATIEAREKNNMTQEELSQKTGLKQSTIARLESGKHSPTTSTLIKILTPLGYKLTIVPIDKKL